MSQLGVDEFILAVSDGPGFYVDVGCHDGENISNTKLLDEKGWKGICIDCFPVNFENRTAKVVKACVYSNNDEEVEFDYSVEDPGCSGISAELGKHKNRLYETTTIVKHTFKTRTLESILDECGAPSHINYLSMDIEGAEFEALRAFPFHRYTFEFISIEHNFEEPKRCQIRFLLESKGYKYYKDIDVDDIYLRKC